ncbi:hypothetical protein QJQ45_007338 [Haematococcus lacustris]|nr:hypothetical protein QJQ45_005409 [Haematococcus lacustris]KAJ9523639.1 hypothetical protein QJQ45_007338 [Haematococcus lacustris]
MATKKAGGTARQNPDTPSRNLGVKFLHGEAVFPGHIMVRQNGTKWHPGYNVGLGRDQTIYAKSVGYAHFSKELVTYPNGKQQQRTVVSVVPVTGDWSPQYKEAEASMLAARAELKRHVMRNRAKEAALWAPVQRPPPNGLQLAYQMAQAKKAVALPAQRRQ